MRSSPKRICGFIAPVEATTSPRFEIAQMRGDRGRAHIHRKSVDPVVESRPDPDEPRTRMHGDGDFPLPLAQRRLQALQHRQVAAQRAELPLPVQRLKQPLQIPGRVVHVRLAHLDVVQVHDRIKRDRALVGGLAHHLAMHLAACGHVDNEVALNLRGAGEAVPGRQRAALRVALLGRAHGGEIFRMRAHTVLGEIALRHQHLTAAAERAPAAHRVDVHPERARCLQQLRADGEASALARRREDDQWILLAHAEL